MTLRQRIFTATGVIVGLLIVLAVGYYFFSKDKVEDTGDTQDPKTVNVVPDSLVQDVSQPPPPSNVAKPEFSTEVPRDRYARQIATLFVERFASRSNQSDDGHIEDVIAFTTDRMGNWVKTQSVSDDGAYQGVTTDVVASRIVSINAATAVVEIDAQQRIENSGSQEIVQKSGTVNLIASGDDWKVDGFFWEK